MSRNGNFQVSKSNKKAGRREPLLFADVRNDLKSENRRAKSKRSILRRLIGFCLVLGFWGVVAGGLATGYIFFSLNERGLLKIPQREPGIMILANNGSVLSEQGSFFGDAARIADMPEIGRAHV